MSGSLSFWTAVRLVARREVVERAREKSFLVSTGVTLLILLGAVIVPQLLGAGDPPQYRVGFSSAAQSESDLARRTAQGFGVQLQAVQVEPAAAPRQLAGGDLDAYLDGQRIVVDEDLGDELGPVLQSASAQVRAARQLQQSGLDPAQVAQAQGVPALPVQALHPPEPGTQARERIAFIGTFLLYGQLIGYGFWVATGIVEEKSSRVVEVLLATVRPRALLAGKVLGIGLLALAQLLVLAAMGLAGAALAGVVDLGSEAISPVLVVLGWFVLGFAFYACLFAAGAARVSRQEDLQSVTTPATMLVLISFFAALYASNNPDSTAARILAVVPPFSALVAPVRTASGDAPFWQLALAVVLMLLAVAALVVVAGRIYEGSVLRMGGTVPMREAWRSRPSPTPAAAGQPPAERAPPAVRR